MKIEFRRHLLTTLLIVQCRRYSLLYRLIYIGLIVMNKLRWKLGNRRFDDLIEFLRQELSLICYYYGFHMRAHYIPVHGNRVRACVQLIGSAHLCGECARVL